MLLEIITKQKYVLVGAERARGSNMLKGTGSPQSQFKDKWPEMKPVVLKLLKQEHVSREEWQDLFWYVDRWLSYAADHILVITAPSRSNPRSVCAVCAPCPKAIVPV